MCIPYATSKWGLGESEWIGLLPEGLCVHDEPPIKTCSQWTRERICGECLSICLSILLVFCPTVRYLSGGKNVRVYVDPIRGFPFPLEICTPFNISHIHAEIVYTGIV